MLLCIGFSNSFAARPGAGCAASRSHAIARTSSLSLSAADDSLYASLRSRLAVSEGAADAGGAPAPLGVDDVGAEKMGPDEVLTYVMKSLVHDPIEGCKACMSFSVKEDETWRPIDSFGQLRAGAFRSPEAFSEWLGGQKFYATLTKLEEFKPMGPVQMSDMSRNAEQKFLVRRPGANWEDLTVKLRLMEGDGSQPWVKRWVITSLYKHHGPENIA
jgi:hypothetical protein